MVCQVSVHYLKNNCIERRMGFEPTTSSLGNWSSTPELPPLTGKQGYKLRSCFQK